MDEGNDVTRLLDALRRGEAPDGAISELYRLVYDDLREVAGRAFRREYRVDHTLQPTALVHEAFIRLADATQIPATNREHLLGIMAIVVQRVLVDHGRRRRADKRGGGVAAEPLDAQPVGEIHDGYDLVEVADAVDRLAETDEAAGTVARLKIFAGASNREIAAHLGVPPTRVDREWTYARAWLQRTLKAPPSS